MNHEMDEHTTASDVTVLLPNYDALIHQDDTVGFILRIHNRTNTWHSYRDTRKTSVDLPSCYLQPLVQTLNFVDSTRHDIWDKLKWSCAPSNLEAWLLDFNGCIKFAMNCTLFHVKNYAGSVKDFISNLGKMNIFISNITTIQHHCVLPSNNPTNLTVLDNNDISDFTLIIGYNYGATIYSSTTTTIDKLAEDVLSISFTVVILKRQYDQLKSCTDGTVSTVIAEGYPMSTRPSGGLAYVFVDQPKRDAYLIANPRNTDTITGMAHKLNLHATFDTVETAVINMTHINQFCSRNNNEYIRLIVEDSKGFSDALSLIPTKQLTESVLFLVILLIMFTNLNPDIIERGVLPFARIHDRLIRRLVSIFWDCRMIMTFFLIYSHDQQSEVRIDSNSTFH